MTETSFIARLHGVVDELVAPLERHHADRLRCVRGCHHCCVDGLTVFEVEADLIRLHHGALLNTGVPHPAGACAMLDEQGACRVYQHRPYVCRTQGLPLRWAELGPKGEPVERRDICPKNLPGGPDLRRLEPAACWTLGPVEQRLREAQTRADGGELRRIALRDLFASATRMPPDCP
jgi:hypothetical protein